MSEKLSSFILCPPNGQGSSPVYRFLHGVQFLQMTKIPFGSLHFLETTNFGHNGNMLFLVLQVDELTHEREVISLLRNKISRSLERTRTKAEGIGDIRMQQQDIRNLKTSRCSTKKKKLTGWFR